MPDQIDLGALRSRKGYFLRRDVTDAPFPSDDHGNRPDTGWRFGSTFRDSSTTLRDDVLALIRSARRKVFVTSFILGDDALIEELVCAADRLTGGVYVICGLSERSLRRGLEELAKGGDDVGAKVEVEKKRFTALSTRGVAVRGHENCHAKFVVVDDDRAWVGSANLETRAFTVVGEVGVVTDDPAEVDRLARKFARMWLADCGYELPASAHEYDLNVREGTPAPFDVPEATQAPSIIWTDETSKGLLAAIHDVIGKARSHLMLTSYFLNRMSERHELLVEPLRIARDRGVEVEILVRAENNRDQHRADASLLHDLGVRLVADDHNHAKAVVADGDRAGLLFSANFDLEYGLLAGRGVEVGARLDGTTALTELSRYLRHALDHAPREFVRHPTARQLDHGLDARWKRRWPLAGRVSVDTVGEAWDCLTRATSPVLWRPRDGAIELFTEGHTLRLTEAGSAYRLTPTPEHQSSDEVLARWWGQRRGNKAPEIGGICPAEIVLTDGTTTEPCALASPQ